MFYNIIILCTSQIVLKFPACFELFWWSIFPLKMRQNTVKKPILNFIEQSLWLKQNYNSEVTVFLLIRTFFILLLEKFQNI